MSTHQSLLHFTFTAVFINDAISSTNKNCTSVRILINTSSIMIKLNTLTILITNIPIFKHLQRLIFTTSNNTTTNRTNRENRSFMMLNTLQSSKPFKAVNIPVRSTANQITVLHKRTNDQSASFFTTELQSFSF